MTKPDEPDRTPDTAKRRTKLYHCPECGSTSAWKLFLVRSGPVPCPKCGTSLVVRNGAPWDLHVLVVGLLYFGAVAVVAFRTPHWGRLDGAIASVALFIEIVAFFARRRHWVQETLGLSEDEIRSRVRIAEGFIRQGASLREAAEKLSVPSAVLHAWRKRYGAATTKPSAQRG